MLTNKQFRDKLQDKQVLLNEMEDKYDKYYTPKYSSKRVERQKRKQEEQKKKTCAIVPFEIDTSYYRSEYEDFFNVHTVKFRIKNLKEYYIIHEMTIDELKEFELMQMQEHFEHCKKETRKYFNRFIKSYIAVDNGLMLNMIEKVANSPQQAYKMRTQWERAKTERMLSNNDLSIVRQLRTMTVSERNQIKGMFEYNQRYIKKA